GDVCPKPVGTWVTLHERCLLGDGTADPSNFVLPAAHLGVRGEFNQVAGPRALVTYRSGELYFHGGASLQEAVVPVIAVRLRAAEEKAPRTPTITLSYKDRARRITTRLPVIKVTVESGGLFTPDHPAEILLQAHAT